MTTLPDHPTLRLPRRLFLFSSIIGLLTPFIARLPIVPIRGWAWLTDYFLGFFGLLFFSVFNLIPSIIWWAIGKGSDNKPLAFWFSLSGGIGFLLLGHGILNLHSTSTAVLALPGLPIYAVGASLVGWVLGLVVNANIEKDGGRLWTAWITVISAIIIGTGFALHNSHSIVKRESRFPFLSVSKILIEKHQILERKFMGPVEALAFGDFDNNPGNEIVALGRQRFTMLKSNGFDVMSKTEFKQNDSEGGIGTHPYVVSDGKGGILISTSEGVSDVTGHLIWQWKADSVSRVVPIKFSDLKPKFFAYDMNDHVVLHDTDGKILWRKNLPASKIGSYETKEGEQLPFAVTDFQNTHELKIFSQDGKLQKTIILPSRVSDVKSVAWPEPGNFLIGSSEWIGVLDSEGKEVLKHIIKDTSFDPYHGPDGTAVKFFSNEASYLAVLSHGSSGYARSVLLIFDPKGNLVWQEELKKISTLIAVPNEDNSSEGLLLGGIDGIIEYRRNKKKLKLKED